MHYNSSTIDTAGIFVLILCLFCLTILGKHFIYWCAIMHIKVKLSRTKGTCKIYRYKKGVLNRNNFFKIQ